MEPASGTATAIVVVLVVVVVGALWMIFSHSCRLVASGSPVTVKVYQSTQITVTLQRKNWALGSWSAVVPATYTASSGASGKAGASVTGSPTTAAAPAATITVSGAAIGEDNVLIQASGGDCTNIKSNVPVTVTET